MQKQYPAKILPLFLAGIIFIFSGCASTSRWAQKVEWDDFSLAETPTAADYPEMPAVVLLDDGELEVFEKMGYARFKRRTIIKILNRNGSKFANISIPYASKTEVTEIRARTIHPSGEITILAEDDIYDVNMHPEFMLYSDVRAKKFTLPAVDVGCIIEYTFTKRFANQTYWSNWVFQQDIPTRISRFSLKIPHGWEYRSQNYFIDVEPQKVSAPAANTSHYVWEARDIPEYLVEPNMPPLSRTRQRIEFSPAFVDSWQDIGNWFWKLADKRMQPTASLKAFTESLLKGAKTDREKLERIFNFVRQKIRYVAVSIGIGSYQPHFAEDIFHNRYGDCKDMSVLIVALARAAEIPAAPALISTHYNGAVDTLLVSQTQFNHAIACAYLPDGEWVWMDATDKHTPFGELPWYDQDCLVLPVFAADSAKFIRTPAVTADANQVRREWELTLSGRGTLSGKVKIQYSGAHALVQRRMLEKYHPRINEQMLATHLAEICPAARLDSFKVRQFKSIKKPLEMQLYFEAPDFAAPGAGQIALSAGLIRQTDYSNFFPNDLRHYPIELRYPEKKTDFIELKLSPEIEIIFTPRNQLVQTDFGDYELVYSTTENTLQIYRQFRIKTRQVIVPDYRKWKKFLSRISHCDRLPLFLKIQQPENDPTE